jgi:hypothetical protein
LILVQSVINWLILVMGAVLALFTLLLLFLHFTSEIKNSQIQKMREQLLCLISGEADARRMKNRIYDMIQSNCPVGSLQEIRGIRSMRGLQIIAEVTDELPLENRDVLRAMVEDDWYFHYLQKQMSRSNIDSIILVVKLIGSLQISRCTPDVVTQIYCHRNVTQMQHIGLLSLCLLGAEREIISICRDQTIASLLSFRTLEELFSIYVGDREKLCKALITSAADQYIRRTCVKAIGENGYVDLAELVMPLLSNNQLNARIDAVRTLGRLCYEPAREMILALASNERWEMRAVVATALSCYGAEPNLETLLSLLCDREWWVRYRAAESLLGYPNRDELLRRVRQTGDRFALEMMEFTLRKDALAQKGAA